MRRTHLFAILILLSYGVFAQPSKKEGIRMLREYYVANVNGSCNKADCEKYISLLNHDGQFTDMIAYEREIGTRKLLESISFDEQQRMGLYLTGAMNRLRSVAAYYRQKGGKAIPDKYWKAIVRYGTIEQNRQPNDRFHASCFAIPQAACGIYYLLIDAMERTEKDGKGSSLESKANRMLKYLAMQSWTQPLRNDETDRNVVSIPRFRHHVWWVGGNALAYRPLLETAVLMDSIPMVDVVAEVAKKSLSNVSQTNYEEAFWNEGFTADGAGWGHGKQCLVWGYPIHGASSALNILKVLKRTPWAQTLSRENAEALLHFYRGSNFYHYKGYIPPCLDRYSMVYYEGRHQPVPYYEMLKRTVEDYADAFTSAELEELKQLIDEAGQEDIRMDNYPDGMYHGSRWFFNNDDLIKKNKEYHILINMASFRCDGLESASNFADEFNIFTNDGLTFFQRRGDEYRRIIGAMDLTAMPGITAREGMDKLAPVTNWRGFCSKHNFAGGATSGGENAVAGFIFEKMDAEAKEKPVKESNLSAFGVKAYKSWFIMGDYLVALGAGVTNLSPELEGTIRTSIEQTAHQGEVSLFDGKSVSPVTSAAGTLCRDGKPGWIMQQGGFAYTVLPPYSSDAFYSIETLPNEWLKRNLSNKGKVNLPDSAAVFRLWIDQGREVRDGKYGYVVYCGEGTPAYELPFTVWRNDTLTQAVSTVDHMLTGLVFYQADVVVTVGNTEISASEPCVVLMEQDAKGTKISVTDAMMRTDLQSITLRIGEDRITIDMPQGKECGNTVTKIYKKTYHEQTVE